MSELASSSFNNELPLAPVETPEQLEAVARLYGEPMMAFPTDLYIPPDALEVILDAFEGPLDLLLYLIRKTNINILDIPMAPLTAQYLEYVEAMRSHNLELAAAARGRGGRRSACRIGATPVRLRADEAGCGQARRHASPRTRFRMGGGVRGGEGHRTTARCQSP
jgi:hypothetical protein